MDHNITLGLYILLVNVSAPLLIHTIDGDFIEKGTISHGMTVLSLKLGSIRFLITNSIKHPIILGLPWLRLHNLLIILSFSTLSMANSEKKCVIAYIDDILIYSTSYKDHVSRV